MKYEYKTLTLHSLEMVEKAIQTAGLTGLRIKEIVPPHFSKDNLYLLVFERCVESETAEAILYKRLCYAHTETCNKLEAVVKERDQLKDALKDRQQKINRLKMAIDEKVFMKREEEDEHADTLADSREANQ